MIREDLDLSIAETSEDIAACMALRWDVFVVEQNVPEPDELDGQDDACAHVLACQQDRVAGAARFKVADDTVKIQRVCVAKQLRGSGIGAAIINYVCDQSGAAHARLSAQTDALAFYQRLGFQAVGAVYMDAGIPHQDMEKSLR